MKNCLPFLLTLLLPSASYLAAASPEPDPRNLADVLVAPEVEEENANPVTVRQLDAKKLIGGKRTKFRANTDDFQAICRGRTKDKPESIRDEQALAVIFDKKDVRERILEQVDFDREQLVMFAWQGRSGARMSFTVTGTANDPSVLFYDLPRIGDGFLSLDYIYLYAIDKDVNWVHGRAPASVE